VSGRENGPLKEKHLMTGNGDQLKFGVKNYLSCLITKISKALTKEKSIV
jgi:hypothetical protein